MIKSLALIPGLIFSSGLLYAETNENGIAEKGNSVFSTVIQKLGGEVKAQMQQNGPVQTVRYCSERALVLTDQIGKETNTTIKRVSMKNRNPVNAAEKEEQTVLRNWEQRITQGEPLPPYEIKQEKNNSIFYKPIVINNEACLKCHGDLPADSAVLKAVHSLYQDDKATGYKMGDLRGMMVITIPR